MAPFNKNREREKTRESEDFENEYGFNKSARGYNAKEVNEFIGELNKKNANVVKNYERKIDDMKNANEMLACEVAELKKQLAQKTTHQRNRPRDRLYHSGLCGRQPCPHTFGCSRAGCTGSGRAGADIAGFAAKYSQKYAKTF